jgi:hypothetical protein
MFEKWCQGEYLDIKEGCKRELKKLHNEKYS